jgi:hypothetical protein
MAKKLYPLVMKAGIKRDGCAFQPDYCTDGDWIRFQKGLPRSMGGMVGPANTLVPATESIGLSVSDLLVITKKGNPLVLVAGQTNIMAYPLENETFCKGVVGKEKAILKQIVAPEILWQSLIVQRGTAKSKGGSSVDIKVQPYLIYYGCPTRNNVSITGQKSINYGVQLSALTNDGDIGENILTPQFIFSDIPNGNNPILPAPPEGLDGGMCYAAPHLFLYGSGGVVMVSKAADCFDFRLNPADPEKNIGGAAAQKYILPTGDKVICGYQTRGGNINTPTLLFWTLSSVTRLTFQPSDSQFKADVISTSSTILSNKSIVEYDGLFFWAGNDRFYVYNGVVNPMQNTLSVDFFFDNLNKTASGLVFGLRFPRYNEIWWFYPSGNSTFCDRAIIYNKAENTWQDIKLPRSAGMYIPYLGSLVTYGQRKTRPDIDPNFTSPFLHEVVSLQGRDWGRGGQEIQGDPNNDGKEALLDSFIVTPFFSFAAFNPLKQEVGIDSLTIFNRIEPNFITVLPTTTIDVTLHTYRYAQAPVEVLNLGSIVLNKVNPILNTVRLDSALQGGHMQLRFSSVGGMFEMGHNIIEVSVGDGQR